MLADAGLIERQGIEGGRPGAFVLALTPRAAGSRRARTDPSWRCPTRARSEGRGASPRAGAADDGPSSRPVPAAEAVDAEHAGAAQADGARTRPGGRACRRT